MEPQLFHYHPTTSCFISYLRYNAINLYQLFENKGALTSPQVINVHSFSVNRLFSNTPKTAGTSAQVYKKRAVSIKAELMAVSTRNLNQREKTNTFRGQTKIRVVLLFGWSFSGGRGMELGAR